MNIIKVSTEEKLKNVFQDYLKNSAFNYTGLKYEKWHWKYMENPFFYDKQPAMWVSTIDDKIAGFLGSIPIKLKAGVRTVNAAWAVDFMVFKDYRKKGLGMSLVKEANGFFDIFLAIGGTGMSTNLFKKMGWISLGKIPYYTKILDLDALLKSKIKNIFIRIPTLKIISPVFKIYCCLKKAVMPKGIEIDEINNFSEEADLFWKEIEHFYKIAVPRNRAYLSWKYDKQPGTRYVKFRVTRDNKICGYAVVRVVINGPDTREGLILEIIIHPEDRDAAMALISAALKHLKGENCPIAHCCVNDRDIRKALTRVGFIKRKPHMRFLIKKNIDEFEELRHLDNWYITAGDSDIDR